MNNSKRYRVHPAVAAETAGQQLLLVHLHSGAAFRLNRTGKEVWRLAALAVPVAEIIQQLEARLDVPRERLEQDVSALLDDLVHNRLLEPLVEEGA